MLLWLTHTTGIRVTELALLEVADVLYPSGVIKPEVYYRQAGIKHGSSHSGRRSLAAKVLAATGDVETVQTILGHACLDHSKAYLSMIKSSSGGPLRSRCRPRASRGF
jgi:site-specific recombinase XerD